MVVYTVYASPIFFADLTAYLMLPWFYLGLPLAAPPCHTRFFYLPRLYPPHTRHSYGLQFPACAAGLCAVYGWTYYNAVTHYARYSITITLPAIFALRVPDSCLPLRIYHLPLVTALALVL